MKLQAILLDSNQYLVKALFILLIIYLSGCTTSSESERLKTNLTKYLEAKGKKDNSEWQFVADTVTTWFDEKMGEGRIKVKGIESKGPWADWDIEMNSYSTHEDSFSVDLNDESVSGIFYEHNDFYDLIGKGPTKSERTFWFNGEGLIKEILIVWGKSNTTTSLHLDPIVEWALKNDSLEIEELYPDGDIIPSAENAKRWKKLLQKYNESLLANSDGF